MDLQILERKMSPCGAGETWSQTCSRLLLAWNLQGTPVCIPGDRSQSSSPCPALTPLIPCVSFSQSQTFPISLQTGLFIHLIIPVLLKTRAEVKNRENSTKAVRSNRLLGQEPYPRHFQARPTLSCALAVTPVLTIKV